MEEKFLFTNICPLLTLKEQELLDDCFRRELKKSDRLEIAVGFSSYSSLKELDRLVTQENVKNVCLILGMYYFNGFPKLLHKLALEINERWKKAGIGNIKLVHSSKYHGKLYCFFKNNQIFSAILGSPNLSFLIDKNNGKGQQEIALLVENPITLKKFLKHIEHLKSKSVSENIFTLEKYKLTAQEKLRINKKKRVSKISYKKFP